MKKFWLFLISLLIGIGLFIWIIKFVGWQAIKNAFLVFTGWQGMVILGLTFLLSLICIWKWKEILKGLGIEISFRNLFRPYFAGFSVMYFFPIVLMGGEVLRCYLLKEKKYLSWTKGMASVIIDRVLDWTTNLITIFFGLIFFLLIASSLPPTWGLIFGGVFISWVAGISFFYFKVFKKESIAKFFIGLVDFRYNDTEPLEIEKEIFTFFKPKKAHFWKGFGLAFLEEVIVFLRTFFLVSFLGKKITPLSTIIINGFSYLATMIPIPASIGSLDVVQAFSFNALGFGAGTGVVFTLIIRGAEIILALFGLLILFRLGLNLLKITLLGKNKHGEI